MGIGNKDYLFWKQELIDDTVKQLRETGEYHPKSQKSDNQNEKKDVSINYIIKNYWQVIVVAVAALLALIKD